MSSIASSQSSKQPMTISGFCITWKNEVINLPSSGLKNWKCRISWVKVDARQVIFKSKSFLSSEQPDAVRTGCGVIIRCG